MTRKSSNQQYLYSFNESVGLITSHIASSQEVQGHFSWLHPSECALSSCQHSSFPKSMPRFDVNKFAKAVASPSFSRVRPPNHQESIARLDAFALHIPLIAVPKTIPQHSSSNVATMSSSTVSALLTEHLTYPPVVRSPALPFPTTPFHTLNYFVGTRRRHSQFYEHIRLPRLCVRRKPSPSMHPLHTRPQNPLLPTTNHSTSHQTRNRKWSPSIRNSTRE